MEKSKAFTVVAVLIGFIILAVVLYAIFAKKTTVKPGVVTTQGGIGGFITGLFGGGGNWLGNIFGGGGGGAKYKCDCDRPGYTRDGDSKESCREGRIDYQIDCE